MGHGSARIARAPGVSDKTIRKLVRGDARTVSPQLRDAIADLYDAWWDKRAPARTRLERAAATAARNRAIAGNWCAAAALDDDQLDTPGYRPRHGWKPATGTGTAPDIRPPPAAEGNAHDRRPHDRPHHRDPDVLDRHGYPAATTSTPPRPSAHRDLAHIYEGTRTTRSAPTSTGHPPRAVSRRSPYRPPGRRPPSRRADVETACAA